MKVTSGIKGLLSSRNGTMSLVILAVSAVLCAYGKIDGVTFAAVITAMAGIYTWTRAKYTGGSQ